MSPNSDNAMARFLFAILKQKNLKDIDWNQVAQDPVLLQPITNGHAARMRYSRFRTTILGAENTRRKSSGDKPNKVSKSKKGESHSKHEGMIKCESGVSLSSLPQYSPASISSSYINDGYDDYGTRFLTPCSDDMTQSLAIDPAMTTAFMSQSGSDNNGMMHSPAFDTFDTACDLSDFVTGADLQSQDPLGLGSQSLVGFSQDWSDRFADQHQL